jgi:4-hydroxybenzoate polyprenyltransferase
MPILLVITSMRPRQWTKNLVLFAALIFSPELFNLELLRRSAAAFVVFCGLSGVVYLMNDLKDRKLDAAHPRKRLRPIASGALGIRGALLAILLVGGLSLGGAWVLGRSFLAVALGYLALNVAYSFLLRNLVLLDVIAIAAGFVLRAIAGAKVLSEAGPQVEISAWLLMCTFFLSLFLGLGKRRHELQHQGADSRASLAQYSVELVDRLTAVNIAITVLCYSLYTIWPRTVEHFGTESLIYTIPFVFYGLSRYLYLVLEEDKGGDPSEMLLTDRSIILTVLGWFASVAWILYFAR